jgi:hypothetical protein
LLALSQQLPWFPLAVGELDDVEVWAVATPTPASRAAQAISPILVMHASFCEKRLRCGRAAALSRCRTDPVSMISISAIAPHQPRETDQSEQAKPAPIEAPIIAAGAVHPRTRLVRRSCTSCSRTSGAGPISAGGLRERCTPTAKRD